MHSDRKRRASALRIKRLAEGATALPKAGMEAQPERLIIAFAVVVSSAEVPAYEYFAATHPAL
jgi:hypothetical protein